MPVRFKGLSEYQRNFLWKKSYLSESCNSSVGRRYPWAGLRSDQLDSRAEGASDIVENKEDVVANHVPVNENVELEHSTKLLSENVDDGGSLNAMWYAEVKELREKAEFYRKRVQGTHFSRDHLNQILSDNNCYWDVSSTTSSEGTISSNIRALDLARRRLAWDAENTPEDVQKKPTEEEEGERDKQGHVGELETVEIQEKSKADKIKEGFSFPSRQLLEFVSSTMAALQKSVSSILTGTLAASCLLLIALSVLGGEAVPVSSPCRLDKSRFQEPYIINRTFTLAKEASLADNNTDVRLVGNKLFQGINQMKERCYLLKQVLNFTVEEVLFPYSDRFQPYMQEVLPFLAKLSRQLSQCVNSNRKGILRFSCKSGSKGELIEFGDSYLLEEFSPHGEVLWVEMSEILQAHQRRGKQYIFKVRSVTEKREKKSRSKSD
ncbi:hypothetical protein CB1_001262016 [Camelus ferus]|nr:hypothetical protein CB1_001262016 [Camelus ferus]